MYGRFVIQTAPNSWRIYRRIYFGWQGTDFLDAIGTFATREEAEGAT